MPRKEAPSKAAQVQLLVQILCNDMHPDVLQRALAKQRLWYNTELLCSADGVTKLAEESHQLLLSMINQDLPEAFQNKYNNKLILCQLNY